MNQLKIREQTIGWDSTFYWHVEKYFVPQIIVATTEQANRHLGDVKQTLSPKRSEPMLGGGEQHQIC